MRFVSKKKKITLQIQTAGSRQEDMVAEGKKLSSDPSPKKNSDIKKFKVFQDQILCNKECLLLEGTLQTI